MTQGAIIPAVSGPPPQRVHSGAPADTPDIVFVLRHFRWLIIAGTLAGLIVAVAAWYLCRRYIPEYTVDTKFQVMPADQGDVLDSNGPRTEESKEEIERTIRRQVLMIESDRILDTVLQSDAFAKDPQDPTKKSHWLLTHSVLPKTELRKVLDVSGVPNTDVFRIAMRGSDPVELASLVNAVADVYMEELRNQEVAEQNNLTHDVEVAQKNLQKNVNDLSSQLEEFKSSHDITAITQAYQIKMNTLNVLTADLIKAQSDTQAAKTNYDSIKKQLDSGTLQLSPEMENQFISHDGTIESLMNRKLELDQDLAVMLHDKGTNFPPALELSIRIDEVRKQLDQERERLRNEARLRMQDDAQNMVTRAEAVEQDLTARRDDLDHSLKDLDTWLVEYRSRSAQIEAQQKLLDEYTRQLTIRQLNNRTDVRRVRRFSLASAPDRDEISFPQLKIFLPGGILMGLLLSFGLAYLLELTNTRIRTPRDVTRTMQLPLLGFVPDQEDDSFIVGDLATAIRTSPGSMIAESFRQIRGRLVAQSNGTPLTALLVASASPAGGSTTVASNLANGIAMNGLRVLLVDANFYRPGLKNAYKNLPAEGLSDVLVGRAKTADVIVPSTELPNLYMMNAGTVPGPAASQLLESKAFRDTLAQLRAAFDMVIFDGAPLNLVSDSLSLASKLEGVITVVRAGAISRGTVARVRDQLKQANANLLGVVLNVVQTRGSGYFKENYRSFYEYAGPAVPTHPAPPIIVTS